MPRIPLAACLVLVLATSAAAGADPLPRRGLLGARLAAADHGVLVDAVLPEGSAGRAGLRAGDVIVRLDDAPSPTPRDFALGIARRHAGEVVTLSIDRAGTVSEIEVTLQPRPLEHHETLRVAYGSVPGPAGRLRSILLMPDSSEPLPAVLFVQGLSCGSIDYPFTPDDPYLRLVEGVAAEGYAVMRVEKSGVGDSEGPPCVDIGLHEETAGFLAALRSLKTVPGVDPDRVFVIGHSMGGVIGPRLALEEPVAGIVAYGTIGKPFIEYMVENSRRQDGMDGMDPVAHDAASRARMRVWHHVYVEGLDPPAVFEAHPDLVPFRDDLGFDDDTHQFGRHVNFFRELATLNLAEAWAQAETPALVIHGEFDWVSSRSDHELIVETINTRRPGTATFLSLPRMDHGFLTYESLEQSFVERRQGDFDPAIVTACVAWLREIAGT